MDNNKNDEVKSKRSAGKHEKHPVKNRRRALIITGYTLGAAIVLVLAAYLVVHSYLQKINYDSGNPPITGLPADEAEDDAGPDSPQDEIDEAGKKIDENLKKEQEARQNTKDLTNILLVGNDTRQSGQPGRSDTMLLLTIDRENERIALTSLMRDMYVFIPGYGNSRINNAFSRGGAPLLIDTIERNFKIDIDAYAAVDFFAFVDAVDALGGVTLDVSYDAFYGVNKAIASYNKVLGLPEDDGKLETYGEQLLTGKQALGYVRNRTFPTGDFVRTENQREFFKVLFEKAKTAGLKELDAMLDAILPGITTDMSELQIISWLTLVPTVLKYDLETYRIPVDDSYTGVVIGGASLLSIDFEKNIAELARIIYGE